MNDNLNNNNFNDPQKIEQNDYYNNDSYYTNDNYENNYSDTTYEEKEKKNGIWWKILLAILVILIIIFLLLKFCGNSGKSKDELYAELSSRVCTAAETYVANNPNVLDRTEPGKSAIIKFQTLADANLIETQIENPYYDGGLFKKGTQPKYYSMDNSVRLTVMNDGTLNCELVDNANDVTPPELRLNGDSEITLVVGTEFEDPGYTATDDYDGDITDKVVRSGNVDMSKAGTYELTYTVQDAAGNVTSKKRKIIYEEYADIDITLGSILDGVTPQISLKGSNPYCMVKGTKYVEPGATATDNVDGNITDRIEVTNKVTGNLMGSFRVVYKVEDSSGNEAIAYRAVIVTTSCPEEDEPEKVVNNRPTISLIGKNAVTIAIGSEYVDLGATAYDKEDGDITGRIITDTSGVKVNSAGVYKVIYRVTDSGGLTATTTRTVTVKQSVSNNPVVRFVEDKSNINVEVGDGTNSLLSPPKAVNENGVAVSVSTSIEDYTTKEAVKSIDWNVAGKYRVIYTAIHGNGVLKQTKSIVVTITNSKVVIGGKDAINVDLRTDNCDINEADLIKGGVTFEAPGTKTPVVSLKDNEDKACKIGTYEVIVEAKVDDGPTTSKKITVYVINNGSETTDPTPVGMPSKVKITGNSSNPKDPYNGEGLWVGGDVSGITLTFEATPASGTEIAHFEWSNNCNTAEGQLSKSSSTTGILTRTEAGSADVCIRAVSTAGQVGPWSDPVKLRIDRTGPSVEFTHEWADGVTDWHNSSTLTLEYSGKDNESGLSHFEYTFDDVSGNAENYWECKRVGVTEDGRYIESSCVGNETIDPITPSNNFKVYEEATGKLTVNENTESSRKMLYVFVRAVDKAGNRGEWTAKPAYANIDTVKPNAPKLTVEGNNTEYVKINVDFTDGSSVRPSGYSHTIYTIDGGEERSSDVDYFSMPLNTTGETVTNNVKAWVVDRAGNRSQNYSEVTVSVAKYLGKFISYNLNGGTISAAGAPLGARTGETVKLGTPKKEGYIFAGWTVEGTGASVVGSNLTVGTSDVKLTANWYAEGATISKYMDDVYNSLRDCVSLKKDSASNIRYVGNAANNYVEFGNSGELWQIVGKFNVKTASGNTESLVKLVRFHNIGWYSWDSSPSDINKGWGVNEWSQSDLAVELNDLYLNKKAGNCYNSADQASVACNFASSGINDKYRSMIETVVWNTGAITGEDNRIISFDTAYNEERGTITGKICENSLVCNDAVARTITWTGKVGLIYPSDYAYASGNESCKSNIYDTNNWCKHDNWLFNGTEGTDYWTMTARADNESSLSVWHISKDGGISSKNTGACDGHFVRPAIYLKSNVIITGGSGTSTDPFKLDIK